MNLTTKKHNSASEADKEQWGFTLRTVAGNGTLLTFPQRSFATAGDAVRRAAEFYLRFDRSDVTITLDQAVFDYYMAPMRALHKVRDDCDLPPCVKNRIAVYKQNVSIHIGWRRLCDLRPDEFVRLHATLSHTMSVWTVSAALGTTFEVLEREAYEDDLSISQPISLLEAVSRLTEHDLQLNCAIRLHLQRRLPRRAILAANSTDFDLENGTLRIPTKGGRCKQRHFRYPEDMTISLKALLEDTEEGEKPFRRITEYGMEKAVAFATEAYRVRKN